MSKWNEKRTKAEIFKVNKELDSIYGSVDTDAIAAADTRAAACGAGEEELFERKMTKEEKKAAAKAAREAKKAAKVRSGFSIVCPFFFCLAMSLTLTDTYTPFHLHL